MYRSPQERLKPAAVLPTPTSRGRLMAVVALGTAATLGWSIQALPAPQPQTHFDSLYRTSRTPWDCTNGNSGGEPSGNNGFCLTDNADTSYYTDSVDGNLSGDIRNPGTFTVVIEREYDDKTDLNMRFQPDPKFTGSGETDIIYQQAGDLPPTVAGRAWCNDAVEGTNECDQHYARFASHTPISYVICHETGHTVGLTHGFNADPIHDQQDPEFACMRTPVPSDALAVIGSSLTSQLNAHY